jgi:Intraflagellar transport protein 43
MSSEQSAGPVAGRRKAADGSDIGGGRRDLATAGWGEAPTIGRRPAVETVDRSTAIRVSEGEEEDGQSRRRGGVGGAEGENIADLEEALQTESSLAEHAADSSSGPRNAGARKIQGFADLADEDAPTVGRGGARTGASQAGATGSAGVLSGIDLSLLTAVIAPPEALEEPDEPWQFDRMLQEISQVREKTAQGKLQSGETLQQIQYFPNLTIMQELAAEQERREAEETAAR